MAILLCYSIYLFIYFNNLGASGITERSGVSTQQQNNNDNSFKQMIYLGCGDGGGVVVPIQGSFRNKVM
ncbi:MAG: hypothetical protein O7D30_11940 [Rickettsia endosymbiont of Ixodes persulcatus]|nr:hypothetical protein [Rickettsia endosymbiont of Ixodes persulcatus]